MTTQGPFGQWRSALQKQTNPVCPLGLIQRYREELEVRHNARRAVKANKQKLLKFLLLCGDAAYSMLFGEVEINRFLSHLDQEQRASAFTWNLAIANLF
jgi:hypothetical protein